MRLSWIKSKQLSWILPIYCSLLLAVLYCLRIDTPSRSFSRISSKFTHLYLHPVSSLSSDKSMITYSTTEDVFRESVNSTNGYTTLSLIQATVESEWNDEIPSLFIYDLFKQDDDSHDRRSMESDCEHSVSFEFCRSLFTSNSRTLQKSRSKLFLVPIFESQSVDRPSIIDAIERLRRDRYFLKFRGSDFLFICYTDHCNETSNDVLHALGDANRSFWISRDDEVNWSCIDRVLRFENLIESRMIQSEEAMEYNLLILALRKADEKIKGRNRWSCEGRMRWEVGSMSIFDFGTVKDTSFTSRSNKVAYCGVPKVGSSVAVLMMRRMNGMSDWKVENTVKIRNFITGYNWTYTNKIDTIKMFDKTDWVKGMLVRDPVSRLLSGYRSKIEILKEYNRIPGDWHQSRPPTFAEFIDAIVMKKKKGNLDWLDRHFRPQSALCGSRDLTYDFIGRYEDREQEMREFLESLELWDSIGATGWGVNGTGSIYSQDERIIRRNELKPVTHADSKSTIQKYYTEDMIKIVMDLYDEDYRRFGFSKNISNYF